MRIPDLTGPKTLPPTILFTILIAHLVDFGVPSNAALMVITLFLLYRYVIRVTAKPADLLVPALLYIALRPEVYGNFTQTVGSRAVAFSLIFSSLRMFFPSFY